MKKLYCLALSLSLLGGANAQEFSDDFEGYNVGDFLGVASPDWRTWSNGGEGTAEDVQIVDNDAVSGSQSIYFSSTGANGGPDDVILPFAEVYTKGIFTFEMMLKVENGKGAYFNYQKTKTIGGAWAMDCFFNSDKSVEFKNGATTYLEATYPQGEWFAFKMVMDLTSNNWECFIDGTSLGTFSNPSNSIAILDLYPLQGHSFWVDDVSYSFEDQSLPPTNGSINLISAIDGLVDSERAVNVEVRNAGQNEITSFDLEATYNGETVTESVTGISLASLATYAVEFANPISLVEGTNALSVTIKNVNGGGDDDNPADDSKSINITPIVPAQGKIVFGEEGTGTWCQWCPRGAVAMDEMAHKYPTYFQGIAVHNGDPMTVSGYDGWMGTKITGYPGALTNRGANIDPSGFEAEFKKEIVKETPFQVTSEAVFITTLNEIHFTMSVTFGEAITNGNQYKAAVVLIEDGVTGTGSGYAQSNAYAGGGNGAMGGYENLPSPVPASQMVYDDVARAILPSATGETFFSANISAGETFTKKFVIPVDAAWDFNELAVAGMLFAPNGTIQNGAVSRKGEIATGIGEKKPLNIGAKLYPNPTQHNATLGVNLLEPTDLTVEIMDFTGKIVASRTYEQLQGKWDLPIVTTGFSSGIYLINISTNEGQLSKKLIIE